MFARNSSGFTLIELMIAVAVVGILTSVAYPAYTSHVVKARRSAVQSFMYTAANQEEKAMLNSRAYFSAANTTQWTAASLTVPAEVAGFYAVTAVADNAATPPTYLITATPTGVQLSRDTLCGTLTLNQAGTKTKSGNAAAVSRCW